VIEPRNKGFSRELSSWIKREQHRTIAMPDGDVPPGSESRAYEHEDNLGT